MKARTQRSARRRLSAREDELRSAGMPALRAYWEARYATGGTSGDGSTGATAQAKAIYINALIRREQVTSVVDWGCGDGQQLDLLELPDAYLGVDISPSAVAQCLRRHPRWAFMVWPGDQPRAGICADLAMSLDVLFHLTRDVDFAAYWARLFASARRLVLIHATDYDERGARHVRHHRHTHLIPDGWTLVDRAADPTTPGFYLWRRQ